MATTIAGVNPSFLIGFTRVLEVLSANTYYLLPSKDNLAVPTDSTGNNPVLSEAVVTFNILYNKDLVNNGWVISTHSSEDCTVIVNNTTKTATVTAIAADTANFVIKAVKLTEATLYRKISVYKAKAGSGTVIGSVNNNILEWTDGSAWYAPYSAQGAGHLDSSSTQPTHTTRLNYDGNFYSTNTYITTNITSGGLSIAGGFQITPIATIPGDTHTLWEDSDDSLLRYGNSIIYTGLSSTTTTGALSSTDWNIFNSKEAGLGNPTVDNYVLSSTIAGVRSWVVQSGGLIPTNAILEWNTSASKYMAYTGATGGDTTFYTGTDNPTYTTRLNLDALLNPTKLSGVITTGNFINIEATGTSKGIYVYTEATGISIQAGAYSTGMIINGISTSNYCLRIDGTGGRIPVLIQHNSSTSAAVRINNSGTSNTIDIQNISTSGKVISVFRTVGPYTTVEYMSLNPNVVDGLTSTRAYLFDTVNTLTVTPHTVFRHKGADILSIGISKPSGLGFYTASTPPTVTTLLTLNGNFRSTNLEVVDKLTVGGLIDPTGLQLTPTATNPGDSYTIWSNSADSNALYFGASSVANASPIDDLLEWDGTKYTPYVSRPSGLGFYTGTEEPTSTTRLNLNGYLYTYGVNTTTSSGRALTATTLDNTTCNLLSGYSGALAITRATAAQTGTLSANILDIQNLSSGTANTTGAIISITDNPTSSGTNTGKVLTAVIGTTERISLNPRTTSGATIPAYLFDTHNNLNGSTDVVATFKNQGNTILSIGDSFTSSSIIGFYRTGSGHPSATGMLYCNGTLEATRFTHYGGYFSGTGAGVNSVASFTNASTSSNDTACLHANVYDNYGHGILISNGAHSGTTTVGNKPFVRIDRNLGSSTANITGNIVEIIDNPSTTGTLSGKILTATIGTTERICFDPRVADGAAAVAYIFDTHNNLTTTGAKISQWLNGGNERMSLAYDGTLSPLRVSMTYNGTSICSYIGNSNTGEAFKITNSSTGTGIHVDNTSTGTPVSISNGATVLSKINSNGEFEVVTSGNGIILASPDGTRYKLTIANGGTLTITAV